MNQIKKIHPIAFLLLVISFSVYPKIQSNIYQIPCPIKYSIKNFIKNALLCFHLQNKQMESCLLKHVYNGEKYKELTEKKEISLNLNEKIILKDLRYILYYQARKLKRNFSYYFKHTYPQWVGIFYPNSDIKIDFYEIYNNNHYKIYIKDFSLKKRFVHLEIINIPQDNETWKSNTIKKASNPNNKKNNKCNLIHKKNQLTYKSNWKIISLDGLF